MGSIPDNACSGFEKQQLGFVTVDGFSGLRPECLSVIVNKLKLEAVDTFTVEQTLQYPINYAAQFKSFIPSQVPYVTQWATVASSLATATWLKISLLEKGDQSVAGPVFDQTTLANLPFSAFEGLRADHVPLIAAADFKSLNMSQTMYFANDTMPAVTADQLRELSPETFGAITPFGLSGLNKNVIPAITGQQIKYLSTSALDAFTCEQLQSFTAEQLGLFSESQREAYSMTYERGCKTTAPPITVTPVAPMSAPVSESPVSGAPVHDSPNPNAPIVAPSNKKDDHDSRVIFIVLGIIAAVLIVGAIIFVIIRKRRADPLRQPLI